jgi:hemolysin activation/secretion protein
LVGAGVGLEFQFLQNVNLRLDWGFALQDVRGTESVDSGDSRVHLSATFLY